MARWSDKLEIHVVLTYHQVRILEGFSDFKIVVTKSLYHLLQDSTSGLKAAVAAGLPVVGVTTGNPGPALLAAGAAFLVKDYNDAALWQVLTPKQALPSAD